MSKSIRVVISVFSWVLGSLNRERRSTVVFGDSPSIAEPNPVCMQDGHTNTIYNKHFNTVVLHLVKAVLHRAAVTIVFMK